MKSIAGLKKLRVEVPSYECTCFEDLRIFAHQIIFDLRKLTNEPFEAQNIFFRNYIHDAILPNLTAIEDFLNHSEIYEDKIEFKVRSLKYHFNFIIDSCIYANMINYS